MLRRLWMRAAAACAFASGHAASVVLRRAEVRPITDRRHDIELVEPYRWLEQQEARDVRRWIAAQNADVKPARYPGTMIRIGDLHTRVLALAACTCAGALRASTTSGRPVRLRYFDDGGHATDNGLPFSIRAASVADQLLALRLYLRGK